MEESMPNISNQVNVVTAMVMKSCIFCETMHSWFAESQLRLPRVITPSYPVSKKKLTKKSAWNMYEVSSDATFCSETSVNCERLHADNVNQ